MMLAVGLRTAAVAVPHSRAGPKCSCNLKIHDIHMQTPMISVNTVYESFVHAPLPLGSPPRTFRLIVGTCRVVLLTTAVHPHPSDFGSGLQQQQQQAAAAAGSSSSRQQEQQAAAAGSRISSSSSKHPPLRPYCMALTPPPFYSPCLLSSGPAVCTQ
jgi:hypothetical protein